MSFLRKKPCYFLKAVYNCYPAPRSYDFRQNSVKVSVEEHTEETAAVFLQGQI